MQKTDTQKGMARERAAIECILKAEDLAQKKANIYSRLLTDASLAEDMETLANNHGERICALKQLIGCKEKKSANMQNEQDKCEENEE